VACFVLQFVQLLGHGRRRDPQFVGRREDAAGTGNGKENTQAPRIDFHVKQF
jgi:hypothetical protein